MARLVRLSPNVNPALLILRVSRTSTWNPASLLDHRSPKGYHTRLPKPHTVLNSIDDQEGIVMTKAELVSEVAAKALKDAVKQ